MVVVQANKSSDYERVSCICKITWSRMHGNDSRYPTLASGSHSFCRCRARTRAALIPIYHSGRGNLPIRATSKHVPIIDAVPQDIRL